MSKKLFQDKLFEVLNSNQGKRISAFDFQGEKYWLKQAEKLFGFMWLLKGNANRSLNREISTLCKMNDCHAPAPKLVCSQRYDLKTRQQGYLVVEDSGLTVKQWLQEQKVGLEQLRIILKDSSLALADLHKMNLAHGRPALRDICWYKGCVTFIDFESKLSNLSLIKHQAKDLLVYIHSLFVYLGPDEKMVQELITEYRRAGGDAIWQEAKQMLSFWQWLIYVCFPFKHIGGRDLKPIYWVLKHFRKSPE